MNIHVFTTCEAVVCKFTNKKFKFEQSNLKISLTMIPNWLMKIQILLATRIEKDWIGL